MERDQESEIKKAAELWNAGEPLEAGRIIFERLPKEVQPGWAARILRLVLEQSGINLKQVDRLLKIAERPEEWHKAHDAFDSIRDQTLKWDRQTQQKKKISDEQEILGDILVLAELVAKVIYNATDPDDEFDEDSGWRIASRLRGFVNRWNDRVFTQAAWSALSNELPAA